MKNTAHFSIAIAILVLAFAVILEARTGRYRVTAAAGIAGVYKVDTRSGDLFICSPVYKDGCVSLEQAHAQIQKRKQHLNQAAQNATNGIDNFTKDNARKLKGMINKLRPEDQQAAPE